MAISAGPVLKYNEAISFLIPCATQEEIDFYWEKLFADPTAEQCGWLKDKWGLSWQVWPRASGRDDGEGDTGASRSRHKATLAMKKFDIAVLEKPTIGDTR
jgi:predicted 3-demethylubiquinone-9 3-methyltransferase (glyoxalase superfamily)